ncbi:MAG: hypothetical protein ABMA64_13685 [Myxococcota bacterium]
MNWKEWVPTVVIVGIVIAGIVYWQRAPDSAPSGVGAPAEDRIRACRALAGEPVDRMRACLEELPKSKLSDPAQELLEKISKDGKVLSVGRFDPGFAVMHLSETPELEPLLMGTDEQPVAKKLHDLGVRGVVVSRDLTGALDRDNVVLARLAHHDFIEWFQLRYVTDDLFVYTVRNSPARVPVETGDQLLKGLRARLEGRPVPRQQWTPDAVRMIGTLRLQGKTLATRHVVIGEDERPANGAVERALDDLAGKLYRDWERKVETEGMGTLRSRLPEVRLEVQIVMERAPVEPRSRFALFDLWEMGVDGMMFRQREPAKGEQLDEKFTYMPGSELYTRSLHSADEFLRTAVKEFGWTDERPWEKDPRTRLDLFRSQHFAESIAGGGPAIRLVRGMPEVPMEWITEKRVQDMLVAGGEWWLANQYPDGSFEYKYWPEQNRRSEDYNEVRHILAARDLADTWRYRNDPRYLAGARRSMDWLLQYEIDAAQAAQGPLPHPPADTMLFRYPSLAKQTPADPANQKLGTVAVGLLGWIAWAESTGSHAEDARIRKMAKFVSAMQEPDGRFRPYFVQSGHAYEKERNDIVPGEAMLALGEVAQYFGEPEWVAAYDKFVEYYQPWFSSRAVRRISTGRWPQDIYSNQDRLDLVQFGPWSVMAARQVYSITKNEKAAKFGLEVADWMIDSYQWSGARSPWPDYVGGYYKLPEELPAMQTFCYSEGTAAAYWLASHAEPARAAKYELGTREAIRFAEVMQFDELDSYPFPRPEKIRGGIKYTMNENKVRIDYVGHGLSTLSQYLDARRADPALASNPVQLWDPTDLTRPAGSRGSVPGLDYSHEPVLYPSGEYPGGAPFTPTGVRVELPPEVLPLERPTGGEGKGDKDDREDD